MYDSNAIKSLPVRKGVIAPVCCITRYAPSFRHHLCNVRPSLATRTGETFDCTIILIRVSARARVYRPPADCHVPRGSNLIPPPAERVHSATKYALDCTQQSSRRWPPREYHHGQRTPGAGRWAR